MNPSIWPMLLVFVALAPFPALAQSIEWIRQFGTEPADSALAIDADGNAYLAGGTFGTFPTEPSFGEIDAYVRKYDGNGTLLWTRQFGTSGFDIAFGIAVAPGRVYVAGGTTGAFPGEVNVGEGDVFVRAYDSDGTLLWTRQFGSASGEVALGVTTDSTGVYVAGQTEGALPGQTTGPGIDAFVRKYDATGTVVWTGQYGGFFGPSPITTAAGVAAPDDGGVYVAGWTDSTLDGLGDFDAYVIKFNAADGTSLWLRQFGDPIVDEQCRGIAADTSGVYVTGSTDDTLPGQVSAGGIDSFARKYDAAGMELWTSQFGTSANDVARSISIDALSVYVSGGTSGVFPGEVGAGGTDGFVRGMTASGGVELWTRQFGGAADDIARGSATDATGVYAAGFSGADAFVRKYDVTGATIWAVQFGASGVPGSSDFALDVSTFGGEAYVVGGSTGSLGDEPDVGGTDAFVRKYDAAGADLWTTRVGTEGEDAATGIAAVPPGVFVVGSAPVGEIDDRDLLVMRLDHDGNVIWIRQFDSPSHDESTGGIAVRSEVSLPGEQLAVYVAGFRTIVFNGGSNTNGFVTKLDGDGTEIWTVELATPEEVGDTHPHDAALDVAVDESGGVYVVGTTAGAFDGQENAGVLDAFLIRLDADGDIDWIDQFGSENNDVAESVAVHDGHAYISGAIATSEVDFDAFARKYSPAGSVQWTREFGTAGIDEASSVSVDTTGVYMTGVTHGTFQDETSSGQRDAFVARIDRFGNFLDTFQFGTSAFDFGHGISVIPEAYTAYVAGVTGGAFPPSPEVPAGSDAFLAKVLLSPAPIPSEQITAILAFFDSSVENGTLVGNGQGQSGQGRRKALRNMIVSAGQMFERGETVDACVQTQDALRRTDGVHPPPDFVAGNAAPELAVRLTALLDSVVGCSTAGADTSAEAGQSCSLSRHDERPASSLLFLAAALCVLIVRRRT